MRILFFLVALVSMASADDINDRTIQTLREPVSQMSFNLVRDYLVLGQVSIGRFRHLNFIVDTGTNRTIVDRHLADRLELRRKSAQVTAVNLSTNVDESVIADLRFGTRRFASVDVLVSDLQPMRKVFGEQIDGIIGMDLLSGERIGIDYSARKITLGACSSLQFHTPFELWSRLPAVEIQLEGRPVRMVLDTGASAFQLFATNDIASVSSSNWKGFGVAGEMALSKSTLRDVRLGNYSFRNVHALIVKDHPTELNEFAGFLSPVALGVSHICLDALNREFSWAIRKMDNQTWE